MGFNTTVVVMNDSLDTIAKDSKFGERLRDAILKLHLGRTVDVPAQSDGAKGCCCNAATVIETHHADGTSLVAVGQNYGELLGVFYPFGEGSREERLLRELADKLGYTIRKKPKR